MVKKLIVTAVLIGASSVSAVAQDAQKGKAVIKPVASILRSASEKSDKTATRRPLISAFREQLGNLGWNASSLVLERVKRAAKPSVHALYLEIATPGAHPSRVPL